MAITSGFFQDGETYYSQAQFRRPYWQNILNGVVKDNSYNTNTSYDTGDELHVEAQAVPDLSVLVGTGAAWINGFWFNNDSDYTVAITANASGQTRIDRIVLHLDTSTWAVTCIAKEGTPAGSPTAPSLTRTGTVYELSLAQVTVASGISVITAGNITDERSTVSVCGYASAIVNFQETIDASSNYIKNVNDPSENQDAATKAYVDANLISTTTITKTYSDLSGLGDISVYSLPDNDTYLSGTFVITSPFSAGISPVLCVNDMRITNAADEDASANGQIDVSSRTYMNKSGGTKSIVLNNYYSIGTWTTDAAWNLNTGRTYLAGCGTQTAALSFGGDAAGASVVTEKFSGTAWTTDGGWDLNTARYSLGGCGTQTSGLSFGGYTGAAASVVTELFNGTTWSAGAGYNLNTARYSLGGCGTQSAALSCGGTTGAPSAVTELFNGSAWTTGAGYNLNTARYGLAACGTYTAALCFGGKSGALSVVTESFDGATWSTNAAWNINTAKEDLSGVGTIKNAICFGGNTGAATSVTEQFDGSAWKNTGWDLNSARYGLGGGGTQTAALSFGGSGAFVSTTEKWFYEVSNFPEGLTSGGLTIYLQTT